MVNGMTTKSLIESGTVLSESPNEDGTWRVRLINEGKGSSGVYSAELLENYGHAFDGVISFLNHPTGEAQSRNFTEIAGRVVGKTWTEKDAEDGTVGVYANWRPDEDYKRKLENYRDRLGLSVYISGAGEYRESADGSEDFHVTEFDVNDPFRSVDVVIAAGRGGRFEESAMKEIYDSRRSESGTPTVTSAVEKEKEVRMDELKAAIEALTAQVSALVTKEQAAQAEAAQAEADDKAVEARVSAYDAAVDAIEAAELPAEAAKSLRAEARKGVDVAPLIEFAKTVKSASIESATQGRFMGTLTETKYGAWS